MKHIDININIDIKYKPRSFVSILKTRNLFHGTQYTYIHYININDEFRYNININLALF